MILSTNQYHRDYDDSPELRAVDLDRVDGDHTVMTDEESGTIYMDREDYDCLSYFAEFHADRYNLSWEEAMAELLEV